MATGKPTDPAVQNGAGRPGESQVDGAARLLDGAECGFACVDGEGRVLSANNAMGGLVGMDRDTGTRAFSLRGALAARFPAAARAVQQAFSGASSATVTLDGRTGASPRLQLYVDALQQGRRLAVLHAAARPGRSESPELRESEQDPLTGLGNRALFDRLLETWQPVTGDDTSLALILVDLDRFKQVNDTLGHLIGDALLKLVAGRLTAATRAEDRVMRLGGDEFVIFQSVNDDLAGARAVAERVVDLMGRVFLVEGHQVHVGASVGIAALRHGTEDRRALFQHADLALYAAKAAGGGTVRFFEPTLEANARERRELEVELRRALPLKQFVLHYQPQLSLPDGEVCGFEALLRWEHPERGIVPPLNFISLAEEIGEIHAIGEWVLRTACREAAKWPDDLRVAVNLSAVQFEDPTLVERIRRALAEADLPATRLEIEITESVLMLDPAKVLRRLHEIRDLGVSVALDDFGTGYSSLSYLNSFPFSKVKIDKSFVQREGGEAAANALVQSIISLGHRLGMTTLAEGVETTDQYESLVGSGCGGLQGFLVGPPVPGRRIGDYIASLDYRSAAGE